MNQKRILITDKKDIQAWLALYEIENFTLHKDLSVSVYQNVYLNDDLAYFPINFKDIHGDFDCSNSGLQSLVGSPRNVYGNFKCRNNNLTSLEGAPKYVEETFDCSLNKLTSLVGSPLSADIFLANYTPLKNLIGITQKVRYQINVCEGELESLEGLPAVLKCDLFVYHNKIASFDSFPKKIKGNLNAEGNLLTHCLNCPKGLESLSISHNEVVSLEGLPKKLKSLRMNNNQLKSLKGISQEISMGVYASANLLSALDYLPKKLGGQLNVKNNPITTLQGVKWPELIGQVNLEVNLKALEFLSPFIDIEAAQSAPAGLNSTWNLNNIKSIMATQEEKKILEKKLCAPSKHNQNSLATQTQKNKI